MPILYVPWCILLWKVKEGVITVEKGVITKSTFMSSWIFLGDMSFLHNYFITSLFSYFSISLTAYHIATTKQFYSLTFSVCMLPTNCNCKRLLFKFITLVNIFEEEKYPRPETFWTALMHTVSQEPSLYALKGIWCLAIPRKCLCNVICVGELILYYGTCVVSDAELKRDREIVKCLSYPTMLPKVRPFQDCIQRATPFYLEQMPENKIKPLAYFICSVPVLFQTNINKCVAPTCSMIMFSPL